MSGTDGNNEWPFASEGAEQRAQTRNDLDRAAVELQEKRAIAESVKTENLEVVDRIKALGFDAETAKVLDLLPLIHVAWADGEIQKGERATILDLLKFRKIPPSSAPWVLIESLLEDKPSEAYMEESLAVLKDVLESDAHHAGAVVLLCVAVAEAAGGFFGFGNKVDPKEEAMIERVAKELGDHAFSIFRSKLGLA
jgi:tellurite resistance protein